MELTVYIADAFTEQQFKGNSAAVILLENWLEESLMQAIALENNLSETAFVVQETINNESVHHIRWFSPLSEIDFCGHATLATAFVIYNQTPDCNELHFYAKAVGKVTVIKTNDDYIQMCFPNRAPELVDIPPKVLTALHAGLSVRPKKVLRNQQAYFAIYEHEDDVRHIQANSAELKKLAPFDIVVTAPASTHDKSSTYDFISRYFWPASGGDEDPVTGSIHTGLAPYWAKQLNKSELVAFQASKRGGVINCKVKDDTVVLSGKAVMYLKGTIFVG